ncbi:hypothetical protein GCM10011575_30500 [Microlunatus endophyticus]|uniref:Uncharacterized protein n=1 Tax=Microlunatus endophyticus TaxID=1716077 RepID=A0A917SCB5_9ACTN|nr:hypothetical protein GCM10011575_30500 [Microlunatus endophyticus]
MNTPDHGHGVPVLVVKAANDTFSRPSGRTKPGGRQPLVPLIAQAEAMGLDVVPVVGPNCSDAYIAAVAAVVRRRSGEFYLRLPEAAWPDVSGPQTFGRLLQRVGTSTSNAHLILDIQGEQGPAGMARVTARLRSIWALGNWRSVTLTGAGMPDVSRVRNDQPTL